MNRIIGIILITLLSLVVAGCSFTQLMQPGSDTTSTQIESVLASSEPSQEYTFRNTFWGMNMDEVIASEKRNPDNQDDKRLYYLGESVSGLDCWISYSFDNNELLRGLYIFEELHSELNDYISDYEKLVADLTEKYGDPMSDTFWDNDLYKNNPADYGKAVAAGHLQYISTWELDKVIISCCLYRDSSGISLVLFYSDPSKESPVSDTAGL